MNHPPGMEAGLEAVNYYDPPNLTFPFETVTPSPHHPLGAKGVGESATVGAPPAIVNAVVDALAHLGSGTSTFRSRPRKVWKILREKGVPE